MRIALIAALVLTTACSHREEVGVADPRQYAADLKLCEGDARAQKTADIGGRLALFALTAPLGGGGGSLGGADLSYGDLVEGCLNLHGYTLQ